MAAPPFPVGPPNVPISMSTLNTILGRPSESANTPLASGSTVITGSLFWLGFQSGSGPSFDITAPHNMIDWQGWNYYRTVNVYAKTSLAGTFAYYVWNVDTNTSWPNTSSAQMTSTSQLLDTFTVAEGSRVYIKVMQTNLTTNIQFAVSSSYSTAYSCSIDGVGYLIEGNTDIYVQTRTNLVC